MTEAPGVGLAPHDERLCGVLFPGAKHIIMQSSLTC